MEELRIAAVHALSDLDNGFLEVKGELVMRQARRLVGYANHPDPMLDLDRASIRFHLRADQDYWEDVEAISLNRDRVLLIIPLDEADPGEVAGAGPSREVRVKVICRGLIVTGFVTVPVNSTISTFIHETQARFIGVGRCRIMAAPGAPSLQDFPALHEFCLVNRSYITACIETRPQMATSAPLTAERESG